MAIVILAPILGRIGERNIITVPDARLRSRRPPPSGIADRSGSDIYVAGHRSPICP
jgi:hypothetical protein